MSAETTLHRILLDELRDIYHAERQQLQALPRVAKAATLPKLRETLERHQAETADHVVRVERAFELLGETATPRVCHGMLGIVEEACELIDGHRPGAALDAGIIAATQRAEHYEIGAYGTLVAWAKALNRGDVADVLLEILANEKAIDATLSELAEAGVNAAAASDVNREGPAAELEEDLSRSMSEGYSVQNPSPDRSRGQTEATRRRNGARPM